MARPEHFTINRNAPLAIGAVFLGLGQQPFSTRFRDEARGNHGTLTDMDPATDWVDAVGLGRKAVEWQGGIQKIITASPVAVTGSTTRAAWFNAPAVGRQGMIDDLNVDGYAEGATFLIRGNGATGVLAYYSAATGWIYGATVVRTGAWTHCAIVVNASVGVSFYLDGVLDVLRADTT